MPPGIYVRKKKVDYSIYRGEKPRPRPVPTPRHQAFYNKWRDTERRAELESKGFLMGPLNAPDSNRLRPDSGPARSRSVSSDRSPRATDGSTPGAESDEKPRGRGGRVGPLNAVTKAKAAFMRQLGACDVCHHRRVGCYREHWDLSLFEKSWCELRGLTYKRPKTPEPQSPEPEPEPEFDILMPDIFMDPALFAEAPLSGSPSSFWLAPSSSPSPSSSDEVSGLSKAVKQVKIASPKTKKQKQQCREPRKPKPQPHPGEALPPETQQVLLQPQTHVPPPPQYIIPPEPQYIQPQQLDLSFNALGIFDGTFLNVNVQSLFPTPIAPALLAPAPATKKKHHKPSKPKSQVVQDPLRELKIHKRQHLELLLDSLNNFIPGRVFTKEPNPPAGTYKHVPIGAHAPNPRSNIKDEWTCLFTPTAGQPPCNRKLRSLATQIYHFYWEHHAFDGMELISRCKGCGSGWRDCPGPALPASEAAATVMTPPPPACPHCGRAGPHDKVLWGALVEVSGVRGNPGATFIVEGKHKMNQKPEAAAAAVEDEDGDEDEDEDDALASAAINMTTQIAETGAAEITEEEKEEEEEEAVTVSTLGGAGLRGGTRMMGVMKGCQEVIEGHDGVLSLQMSPWAGVTPIVPSFGIENRVVVEGGDDDAAAGAAAAAAGASEKIQGFQPWVDEEMDMRTWSAYVELGMSLDQVESLRYTF